MFVEQMKKMCARVYFEWLKNHRTNMDEKVNELRRKGRLRKSWLNGVAEKPQTRKFSSLKSKRQNLEQWMDGVVCKDKWNWADIKRVKINFFLFLSMPLISLSYWFFCALHKTAYLKGHYACICNPLYGSSYVQWQSNSTWKGTATTKEMFVSHYYCSVDICVKQI